MPKDTVMPNICLKVLIDFQVKIGESPAVTRGFFLRADFPLADDSQKKAGKNSGFFPAVAFVSLRGYSA